MEYQGALHRAVGVGIMIAHNPLHGSGQAGLPHPALTLGNNAHAAQGIRMTCASCRARSAWYGSFWLLLQA